MSPNQVIPVENGALSPIAERVLKVPSLTYDVGKDGIVIAVKAELIVHSQRIWRPRPSLRGALEQVAERRGTLAEIQSRSTELVRPADDSPAESEPAETGKQVDPDYEPNPNGPFSQLEIWRLTDARPATRSTSHGGCGRWARTTEPRRRRRTAPAGGLTQPRSDPVSLGRWLPGRAA